MANSLYDKGREKFLKGLVSWDSDDIKCVLVDVADYVVDLAADEFLDDIAGAAIVATSPNLAGKTTTAGVADADDATFTTVAGDVSEALVIYQDTGVAATSPLLAYIDTATGLPITPGGGNIVVQWASGASKIFKL